MTITISKPDEFTTLPLRKQIETVVYAKIYKGKDLLEAKNMPTKAYHILRSELLDAMNSINTWDFSYDKETVFKLLTEITGRVSHFLFDDEDRARFFCNQLIYCTIDYYKMMK